MNILFIRFGEKQAVSLHKIRVFYQDTSLIEDKQGDIRAASLERWDLPSE